MAKLLNPEAGSPIFNPKTLDPETLSQEFCGACHRGVDTVAMMPDLGGIRNVRFQPYRLFNSRGHYPKDPHFACTACHDPHVDLQQEDVIYDLKCTVCHSPRDAKQSTAKDSRDRRNGTNSNSTKQHKPCPIATEWCVSCHLPKVDLPDAHSKFTDHRIRIVRPKEPYPY